MRHPTPSGQMSGFITLAISSSAILTRYDLARASDFDRHSSSATVTFILTKNDWRSSSLVSPKRLKTKISRVRALAVSPPAPPLPYPILFRLLALLRRFWCFICSLGRRKPSAAWPALPESLAITTSSAPVSSASEDSCGVLRGPVQHSAVRNLTPALGQLPGNQGSASGSH